MKRLAEDLRNCREAPDPIVKTPAGLTPRHNPYTKPPSPSGPATDFRGEPAPKNGSLADLILNGWDRRAYLKSRTRKRVISKRLISKVHGQVQPVQVSARGALGD